MRDGIVTMKRAKQWYKEAKKESEVPLPSLKQWIRKNALLFKNEKLSTKLELLLIQ